jgi:hypothetical protein
MTASEIVTLCQGLRCQTATEKDLQDALEPLLRRACSILEREKALSPKDVVDFLVDEKLVVEVKVDGSPMAVTRQLMRYAEHESVHAIVLVTTRKQHVRQVPETLRGKPVDVAYLSPF